MTTDDQLQNSEMNEVTPTNKRERSQIERARRIIYARQMQKLAKGDNPVFLAIVRTNETPAKRKNRSRCREAKFAAAHGITEGQKRQINKRTGPKKDFATVEERERQVLESVPDQHREN